jgi:dihydroorotate dehydrogenase
MKIINVLQDFKNSQQSKKPLFLKIAPDLNIDILKDIVAVYQLTNLDALVISNTTIDFDILKFEKEKAKNIGAGGLSGKPIFEKSNQIIREIKYIDDSVRIIGVGGIDSGAKANVKLDLGCELVQIYTGFIYKGPSLIKEIVEEIG